MYYNFTHMGTPSLLKVQESCGRFHSSLKNGQVPSFSKGRVLQHTRAGMLNFDSLMPHAMSTLKRWSIKDESTMWDFSILMRNFEPTFSFLRSVEFLHRPWVKHNETWQGLPPQKHEADKHLFPKHPSGSTRLFFATYTLRLQSLEVFTRRETRGKRCLIPVDGINEPPICREKENLLFFSRSFFGVCRMLLIFTSHWKNIEKSEVYLSYTFAHTTNHLHIWANNVATKAADPVLSLVHEILQFRLCIYIYIYNDFLQSRSNIGKGWHGPKKTYGLYSNWMVLGGNFSIWRANE